MFKASVHIKILLLLLLCRTGLAQSHNTIIDSIIKHEAYYSAKKSNKLVFVHLDKNVYVNNDMMWFTAYLLGTNSQDMLKHEVLSAALINNNDQKVAVQGRFVMQAGRAYGTLTVPDTIPPGRYSFVAYTNRMVSGKPEVCFIQAITIKTAADPSFNVELTLDTLYKDPDNVRVIVNARAKNAPLSDAGISYYLGKNVKTRIAGKAKTNVIGSYTVMLPRQRLTAAEHSLEILVKSGKETKTLHLDIPIKKNMPDVKFYPEGGHIITGLSNKIGWEVKTPAGTPIKASGILYADNAPLDTISTDSYGMGMFYINTVAKANYTLKLLDGLSDAVYKLPEALATGLTMQIRNALVRDTLLVQLKCKSNATYHLVVHNYKQVFSSAAIKSSPKGINAMVALGGIPRGITTITILDSLQRPCAERLFFAHYDQKPRVSIAIDDSEPGTRQKITLKLKLNNQAGAPTSGLVSVACVQDNRFELKNDNNIEHYVYLQSELDNLPFKDNLMGDEAMDHQYLNELLLVRGWSKYNWPELLQASTADTVKKYNDQIYTGVVTQFGSALKKPVELALMTDSLRILGLLSTDKKGSFTLLNQYVYTMPDKKVRLIVNGQSDQYIIKVADPYLDINKTLAKNIEPLMFEQPITQTTKEFALTGFQHATHLREVKITASNDKFTNAWGTNACGDYVCTYHILNCTNHVNDPGNHPPRRGEMVSIRGAGMMAYVGCDEDVPKLGMLSFAGIYTAKEFYGADYNYSNPTEPDYLSTICWKHGVAITADKEASISFYTSDITGKFRIVVQGITSNDVVYGESSFVIKKKTP